MKEFKGTPGPWLAVQHYEDCFIVLNEDGYEIVTAESSAILNDYIKRLGIQHWSDDERGCLELSQDEQAANAHLIASSPDLLSALQQLVKIYDCTDGRSWTTSSKRRALDAAHAAIKKALGENQ